MNNEQLFTSNSVSSVNQAKTKIPKKKLARKKIIQNSISEENDFGLDTPIMSELDYSILDDDNEEIISIPSKNVSSDKNKGKFSAFKVEREITSILDRSKIDKGSDMKFTHTSMPGTLNGVDYYPASYALSNKDNKKLKDLLAECIDNDYYPIRLSLTQKVGEYTCPHIDFDFRNKIETNGKRQYTRHDVSDLIKLYNSAFRDIFDDICEEQLEAYVFERQEPVLNKDNTYHDGIHMMYPKLLTETKAQHLVREHVLKNCGDIFDRQFKSINSSDDVIDKAVIDKNNWTLNGTSKIGKKPYKLTSIYNSKGELVDMKKNAIPTRELMDLLDVADRNGEDSLVVSSSYRKQLDDLNKPIVVAKPPVAPSSLPTRAKIRRKPAKAPSVISDDSETTCSAFDDYQSDIDSLSETGVKTRNFKEIKEVKMLVKILSKDRADNYDKWMRVGWCLNSISRALLPEWIEFSKQSEKFKLGECKNLWDRMKRDEHTLGIGSLHRWAKEDSPEEYDEIMRSNLSDLIRRSTTGFSFDVAKVVYELYKHNFKCTSYKHNAWYQFDPDLHRWVPNDKGSSLIRLMSEDVIKQYLKLIVEINTLIIQASSINNQPTGLLGVNPNQDMSSMFAQSRWGSPNDDLLSRYSNSGNGSENGSRGDEPLKRAKELAAVTYKLRDIGFKEKVVKECGTLFGNSRNFVEKLDSNPYLIGFENGVYDLKEDNFRPGRPEDFITMSTGYEYVDYGYVDGLDKSEIVHEDILEVLDFLNKILPEEDVREYVLLLISSFLMGTTRDEKFHIWSGTGANGKSKLVELIENTLGRGSSGGYAAKLSHTVLTRKQSNSSSPSPDLVKTKGRRLATIQETENDDKINTGRMKELTGGDAITARALFQDEIEFKPQFKMVLCCNDLPRVEADDDGTWRRFVVVEFISKFLGKADYEANKHKPNVYLRDNQLADKLFGWKEAFMYILLDKLRTYKRDGITEPEAVLKVTKEYKKTSDIYSSFFSEKIEVDPESHIRLSDCYFAFKEWYKEGGHSMKMPRRDEMKSKLSKPDKMGAYTSKNSPGWYGFRLIEDEEEEEDDVMDGVCEL